jgi:hypothetical protein
LAWKLEYIRGRETLVPELAAGPHSAPAKPDELVDMRFVVNLDRDGFIKKLGAK